MPGQHVPASPTPGSSPDDSTLCDALTDTITRAAEAGRDPRGIAHAILPIVLAEIAGRDEEIARLTAGLEDLRYIEEITRLSPDDDPPADPEQFAVAWAELMRSWKWATDMARRFTGHHEAAAKRAKRAEAERDQALAATARVRALHTSVLHAGMTICGHCSGWNGHRCRGEVKPHPCPTLTTLDQPEDRT